MSKANVANEHFLSSINRDHSSLCSFIHHHVHDSAPLGPHPWYFKVQCSGKQEVMYECEITFTRRSLLFRNQFSHTLTIMLSIYTPTLVSMTTRKQPCFLLCFEKSGAKTKPLIQMKNSVMMMMMLLQRVCYGTSSALAPEVPIHTLESGRGRIRWIRVPQYSVDKTNQLLRCDVLLHSEKQKLTE